MRSSVSVWLDWETCIVHPVRAKELLAAVTHILNDKKRYEAVGSLFGIPFWVIGAIHYRESSFDFTTWLANGDPLYRNGRPAPTNHVPIGLGPAINWESASILSLQHERWSAGMDWDLVSALMHLERYNGLGYYKHMIQSPYIWAGTNHYHSGKYSSDGRFDSSLADKQLGCAAIAQGLKAHGVDLLEKQYV